MRIAFDHPAVLTLLLVCVPVVTGYGTRWFKVPASTDLPQDRASVIADGAVRLLAALPVGLLVLALSGMHEGQQTLMLTSKGAHIAVVLDRSLSMDEPFALNGEKAVESKNHAAVRMIADLFARRPHDQFSMVAFSTSPILAMPLTAHREAVAASIAAMDQKGLANTDIGAGIAMGLAQLNGDASQATKVLLLVTDGAGVIPEQTQTYIRAEARRQDAHIYYLYLRAGDDPPLAEDIGDDINLGRPSGLDAFLRNLGVAYTGFEARDPHAVQDAAKKIDGLETAPLIYREIVPRRDYDGACYAGAAFFLLMSLLAQLTERGLAPWPAPGRR